MASEPRLRAGGFGQSVPPWTFPLPCAVLTSLSTSLTHPPWFWNSWDWRVLWLLAILLWASLGLGVLGFGHVGYWASWVRAFWVLSVLGFGHLWYWASWNMSILGFGHLEFWASWTWASWALGAWNVFVSSADPSRPCRGYCACIINSKLGTARILVGAFQL